MKKKQREMLKTSVTKIKNTVERNNSRPSRGDNLRDGRQTKLKDYIQISIKKNTIQACPQCPRTL